MLLNSLEQTPLAAVLGVVMGMGWNMLEQMKMMVTKAARLKPGEEEIPL